MGDDARAAPGHYALLGVHDGDVLSGEEPLGDETGRTPQNEPARIHHSGVRGLGLSQEDAPPNRPAEP